MLCDRLCLVARRHHRTWLSITPSKASDSMACASQLHQPGALMPWGCYVMQWVSTQKQSCAPAQIAGLRSAKTSRLVYGLRIAGVDGVPRFRSCCQRRYTSARNEATAAQVHDKTNKMNSVRWTTQPVSAMQFASVPCMASGALHGGTRATLPLRACTASREALLQGQRKTWAHFTVQQLLPPCRRKLTRRLRRCVT